MMRSILAALLSAFGLVHAATLTVTTAADGVPTADGKCTLREAIFFINAGSSTNPDCPNSGSAYGTNDTIHFNIPAATDPGCNAGTGVCTIAPLALNALTVSKPLLIDGYTQPGASPNTLVGGAYPNAQGLDMHIKIELDGNALPPGDGGLGFSAAASNSEVRGLAIYGFQGNCLSFGGSGNLVDGNIIGLRADGTFHAGKECQFGVAMGNGQGNNTVGGFAPAYRNLIASATSAGIFVSYSSSNVIAGNLIGTDLTGTLGTAYSFANDTAYGIYVASSSGISSMSIDSNVIADWGYAGIYLAGADHTTIARNAIGIGVGGVALSNAQADNSAGVQIATYPGGPVSANNTVYLNGIAYNFGDGIMVLGDAAGDPTGNRLDRNAIFGNLGLGINLQPVGEASHAITPNDAPASLDADVGPNGLQNFPVISSAGVNAGGGVDIAYTLDSGANGLYSISAYASDACSASGNGEGRYLANVPLSWATNASGHLAQTFTYTPMPANWHAGMWVSLLATDSSGNTSEFSPCVKIAASLAPAASGSPNPLALGASTVGTTTGPQTETITNIGGATLSVGTASITGSNASDFSIATNGCTGMNLAPAATCTITLTSTPSATGPRSANLSLASNDPASPLVISLTATGYPPPTASPSANPLAFGNQTVATTSAPHTETITNTGIAHLAISTVVLAGTNASDFNVTSDTCAGASLAPSATCAIMATFTPGAVGARIGTLTLSSNDPTSPLVISLTGTGVPVAIAPQITSPPPPAGTIGVPYAFNVTATGTSPITFGDGGTLPAGLAINPGSGIISGTPTTVGSYNVTITAGNGVQPDATQSFSLVIAAAAATSAAVPTLGNTALALLSLLLAALGLGVVSNHRSMRRMKCK